MDAAGFGTFQHQIKKNQEDVQDFLKDLNSWKDTISKRDNDLLLQAKEKKASNSPAGTEKDTIPPVRNSLYRKKKLKVKKPKSNKSDERDKSDGNSVQKKPKRIPGHDFRAWDKFDVDEALKEIDNTSDHSSFDEETDEEWEEEKLKQQALYEKDQGNDYFKQGKYNEAVECYTKGITCDPSNAILYANRAMALLKQDKYGGAETDCTDAILLDPTYVKAYLRRATARQKLNKMDAALADFKQVIKLEPDSKFAEREVAYLEQKLKISKEGIVLPVKKHPKDRSKVNYDDVKAKLEEAAARATAQQGIQMKKIVSSENESFKKFEKPSSEDLKIEVDEKPRLKLESTNKPLDKSSTSKEGIKDHSKSSGKVGEPEDLSSPRAPANSFQFQRDWKSVRTDIDKGYKYLKLIKPSQYPKLIGEFLEANMLNQMLRIYLNRFLRDGIDVTEHLLHLSKVKRFAMTIMLMSNAEKSVVRDILEKLTDMAGSKEEFGTIRKTMNFRLTYH